MNEHRPLYDAMENQTVEQARIELILEAARQSQCRCVTPEDMRRMQEREREYPFISASQTVMVG